MNGTIETAIPEDTINAIVELLGGGVQKNAPDRPLCIFLGGHNGSGKTYFANGALRKTLEEKRGSRRNTELFYTKLADLIDDKRLFQEYRTEAFLAAYKNSPEEAGRFAFEAITSVDKFPELRQILDSPVTFVNPDLVAYCSQDCRDARRAANEAFAIGPYYYRALAHLPQLMKMVALQGSDCVVDSTMSDVDSIRASSETIKNSHNIGAALFSCDDVTATARVTARMEETSRAVNVTPSIEKFRKNSGVLTQFFAERGSVMTIDTSADKPAASSQTSGDISVRRLLAAAAKQAYPEAAAR